MSIDVLITLAIFGVLALLSVKIWFLVQFYKKHIGKTDERDD
jgi:hypothetical protein